MTASRSINAATTTVMIVFTLIVRHLTANAILSVSFRHSSLGSEVA
jgi:hypothetical protein